MIAYIIYKNDGGFSDSIAARSKLKHVLQDALRYHGKCRQQQKVSYFAYLLLASMLFREKGHLREATFDDTKFVLKIRRPENKTARGHKNSIHLPYLLFPPNELASTCTAIFHQIVHRTWENDNQHTLGVITYITWFLFARRDQRD